MRGAEGTPGSSCTGAGGSSVPVSVYTAGHCYGVAAHLCGFKDKQVKSAKVTVWREEVVLLAHHGRVEGG